MAFYSCLNKVWQCASSWNKCSASRRDLNINLFSKNNHDMSTTAAEAKYMEFKFTDNKSGFRAHLPGWAFEDINIIFKDIRQAPFVRCWKVLTKLEFLRELAKRKGFMDFVKLEQQGYYVVIKCLNLERVIPYEDFMNHDGTPYAHGLDFNSQIGRIGNTSWQVHNTVYEARTREELFRSSIVYACANLDGRITPVPKWFTERFSEASTLSNFKPLRISLSKNIVVNDYDVLHRSRYQVRYSEINRTGRTDIAALLGYCADAISSSFKEKRPPCELKFTNIVENSVKNIDVDFVSGSFVGDTLVASVMKTADPPNKVFCLLHNNGKLTFVQSVEYDFGETAKL